ncbi:hypothetical protein ACFX2I_028807 [Malus domestica]
MFGPFYLASPRFSIFSFLLLFAFVLELRDATLGELSVDFSWGISSVTFGSPGGTGYMILDMGFQNADLENEALREVGTVGIFGFPGGGVGLSFGISGEAEPETRGSDGP